MSVSSEVSTQTFNCTGTTTYSVNQIYWLANGDIAVYRIDAADVATLLTETTDYTLTGAGVVGGGTLTTVATYSDGKVKVNRVVAQTQPLDIVDGDGFRADTLEAQLDRLTMMAQDLKRKVDASFRLADSDISGASVELPAPVPSGHIKWNAAGTALTSAAFTAVPVGDFEVTNLNTASAIVQRDASGNFAAGTITADLTGDVTGKLNGASGGTAEGNIAIRGVGGFIPGAEPDATAILPGVVELATTAEVQAGTDAGRVPSVETMRAGLIVNGTAVATTSGTQILFGSIPSWAKRITVMFSGVSLSGTDELIVIIGDSGGLESSGYESVVAAAGLSGGITGITTAFQLTYSGVAANAVSGIFVIQLMNAATNTWTGMGNIISYPSPSTPAVNVSGGAKSLTGTLTQIAIDTNGTDTFDAGLINIAYE